MKPDKNSIDIIIEELKKVHGEYMVAKAKATISGKYYKDEDKWKDKFFRPLATNLYAKLPKLDRDNIAEAIRTFDVSFKNHNRVKFIDQILSLIPQPKYNKDKVKERILKHLFIKEEPDEINISFISKADGSKYGIITSIKDLANDIANLQPEQSDNDKVIELQNELDSSNMVIKQMKKVFKDLRISIEGKIKPRQIK